MAKISRLFARWFGGNRPSAQEQRLLLRCKGDLELKERLIASELARRPGLSRAAAADSAVDRWQHER